MQCRQKNPAEITLLLVSQKAPKNKGGNGTSSHAVTFFTRFVFVFVKAQLSSKTI